MVIVDANVFIDSLRNKPVAVAELERIGFSEIVVTDVTAMELFRGTRNKQEVAEIRNLLKRVNGVVLAGDAHLLALQWAEQFCLSHSPVGIPDLLVGAFASINDLELHTYNKKHFRHLPGLRLWES